MKNWKLILSITLAFTFSMNLIAQEGAVDKKPLIEVFTASTCPPCVAGNQAVDGVLAHNAGQYTLIKYQMNWPGTGDPYYMEESAVRRNYYEVSGVPHLRTNGVNPCHAAYWTQAHMDGLLTKKTDMTITAEAAVADGFPGQDSENEGLIVNCQIELLTHAAYEEGLKFYAMIVEQKTFGNVGTNGETIFHNVVQGYVVSSEGEELGALAADETKSYDLSIDLTGSNVETGNDLTLVVYVQNHATTELIQSEMVEVSHSFVDYSASFSFYDDGYDPVDGGLMHVEMAGSEYIVNSQAEITKLFPGTYYYEVTVPGYLPTDGEFTISDTDVEQNIIVEVPPFVFYEDFEAPGIPNDWTFINPQGDYLTTFGGRIVYQQLGDAEDAVYVILPKIVIDQGCVLSLKAGESNGRSSLGVGVVTDLTDAATSYAEIVNYEVFNIEGMRTFGGRLDQATLGDGFLCLKIQGEANAFYYIDNVIVIENEPGYKVQFVVLDQNGEVLPETEVTFMEHVEATNDFGYATYRDCDPAVHAYSVSYKGEVIESGEIDVYEDMVKEISHSTASIEDLIADVFMVYPNPAKEQITLSGIQSGHLQILDLNGRVVKDQHFNGKITISVEDLKAGVYAIQVETKETSYKQKLLISK